MVAQLYPKKLKNHGITRTKQKATTFNSNHLFDRYPQDTSKIKLSTFTQFTL